MELATSLAAIMDDLERVLKSRTVLGEPLEVGDLSLIPVLDVAVGFGAGGGDGRTGPEARLTSTGEGTGGGGGIRLSARAVIAVRDGTATVLPIGLGRTSAVDKLLESIPDIVEHLQHHNED
jgi:uncharacterized spore protein YtfJ